MEIQTNQGISPNKGKSKDKGLGLLLLGEPIYTCQEDKIKLLHFASGLFPLQVVALNLQQQARQAFRAGTLRVFNSDPPGSEHTTPLAREWCFGVATVGSASSVVKGVRHAKEDAKDGSQGME